MHTLACLDGVRTRVRPCIQIVARIAWAQMSSPFWLNNLSMSRFYTGFDSRNELPEKYIEMMDKYAAILEGAPYQMPRAGAALRQWAHGTYRKHDPLDVAFCDVSRSLHVPRRGRGSDQQAMALEPGVSRVVVSCARQAIDYAASASNEARFVYGLASDLVAHHGHAVAASLDIARSCWNRLHADARNLASDLDGVPGALPGPAADPAVEEIDDDVQPMELVAVR